MSAATDKGVPVIVAVPAMFYDDHAARFCNPPEVIGKKGRCLLIRYEANDGDACTSFRLDADYYANPDNMDECPRSLVASAQRTVAALARCGGAQ